MTPRRSLLPLVAALLLVSVPATWARSERAQSAAAKEFRISLSVPSQVTSQLPTPAAGKVLPPRRGRVLLQVRNSHGWRQLAAGVVHHGRFRLFFVPQGPVATALPLRAVFKRGRRSLARSEVVRVHLRRSAILPSPQGSPDAPAPAVAPAQALEAAPENASPADVYWGAWIGSQLTGTAAPWDMGAVTKFEQMTGKDLSMVEFSSPFADCSTSPCSYFGFPGDLFSAIRAHGAIPFFSWGSQSIPGSANQPDFQLADILAGTYDSYIREWAVRAAEWGHPFFLRFDWEMNGSWFTWGEGANGNQPGEFVAAWRHVHDIFTSVGATNATWVWCPYVNQSDTYQTIYPGDSYVDWTCLDGYNWGTNPAADHGWTTFDHLFAHSYATVTEALAPSKPMLIGETGASEYGGSKASWIAEMFDELPTEYPRIQGLLWFETIDNGMDWPVESSESSTAAFAAGISGNRYLGGDFGNISASPIPAPSTSAP